MTSRERINAAVNFKSVDRPPFDFFEEAGYLFSDGKYNPSLRLGLDYAEQVEARVKFHKTFNTDLIFDVPVLAQTKTPYSVSLFHNGREINSPSSLYSSVSAMAWNAMPPKVLGDALLPKLCGGKVIKKISWGNGISSEEELDLASGTTDALKTPFQDIGQILDNLDCVRGDMADTDYSYLELLRGKVGPDVMLSGTVIDPMSAIGWYIGIENLLFAFYDDEKHLLEACEKLTEFVIETSIGMLEHGMDMFRLGAATSCLLSPGLYEKFCMPFQKAIVDEIGRRGGIVHIHMCGKVRNLLDSIIKTGAPVFETITPPPLGDTELSEAKRRVGSKICLKGNLSPTGKLLYGTPEETLAEAEKCVETGRRGSGFIFSVADNLAPGTPLENIRVVSEYLRETRI